MHVLDWLVFFGFLLYVVVDGLRRARGGQDAESYFVAGRSIPWWGVGLSIMATQASAITMVGTTGQGWADGLRFIQFYFALPLAMLILAVTAVPAFHRAKVSTAYEYLGARFDAKTRWLAAVLFLVLRGLSVGFIIYAPSLVLAKVFALPLELTVLIMGGAAVVYTAAGGLSAVIATDVKQMLVMTLGLLVALGVVLVKLHGGVGLGAGWNLAEAAGRTRAVDWSWNPAEKYTVWSSLLGGLFLFLSYFGTDQSQVQRLLAGRSVAATRGALLLNALAKIPFQLMVLTLGVLLFVFYQTHDAPLSFEPVASDVADRAEYQELETRFSGLQAQRDRVQAPVLRGEADRQPYIDWLHAERELRAEAVALRGGKGDVNYVFLDFILRHLPVGLAGLLLSAILAAALSSIDSEINSMATVVVVDGVQVVRRAPLTGRRLMVASRVITVGVGLFATGFALYAGNAGSLIESVNRVGSYLYGSLLGMFLLGWLVPRATGHGAFWGGIAGMVVVGVAAQTDLAFLYLNTVGVVTVMGVGAVVSLFSGEAQNRRT